MRPLISTIYWSIASVGLLSLSGMFIPQHLLAATSGSVSGANIKASDGDTIIADRVVSPGWLYGVMTPPGQPGTADLGSHVTVRANDPAGVVRGIIIEGHDSILRADALTVEVNGNSATGISISGSRASAELGADSHITVQGAPNKRADGITLSNASTLTAERLSVETIGDYGSGIKISDYGSTASLGSGSTVSTNGRLSYGIYIAGFNGTARLTADGLRIST